MADEDHTRLTRVSQVKNVYKINIDFDAQSLLIHFLLLIKTKLFTKIALNAYKIHFSCTFVSDQIKEESNIFYSFRGTFELPFVTKSNF